MQLSVIYFTFMYLILITELSDYAQILHFIHKKAVAAFLWRFIHSTFMYKLYPFEQGMTSPYHCKGLWENLVCCFWSAYQIRKREDQLSHGFSRYNLA